MGQQVFLYISRCSPGPCAFSAAEAVDLGKVLTWATYPPGPRFSPQEIAGLIKGLLSILLGDGFKHFWNFHPDPWGNHPIWRSYFSDGLKPPTRLVYWFPLKRPAMKPSFLGGGSTWPGGVGWPAMIEMLAVHITFSGKPFKFKQRWLWVGLILHEGYWEYVFFQSFSILDKTNLAMDSFSIWKCTSISFNAD